MRRVSRPNFEVERKKVNIMIASPSTEPAPPVIVTDSTTTMEIREKRRKTTPNKRRLDIFCAKSTEGCGLRMVWLGMLIEHVGVEKGKEGSE